MTFKSPYKEMISHGTNTVYNVFFYGSPYDKGVDCHLVDAEIFHAVVLPLLVLLDVCVA